MADLGARVTAGYPEASSTRNGHRHKSRDSVRHGGGPDRWKKFSRLEWQPLRNGPRSFSGLGLERASRPGVRPKSAAVFFRARGPLGPMNRDRLGRRSWGGPRLKLQETGLGQAHRITIDVHVGPGGNQHIDAMLPFAAPDRGPVDKTPIQNEPSMIPRPWYRTNSSTSSYSSGHS